MKLQSWRLRRADPADRSPWHGLARAWDLPAESARLAWLRGIDAPDDLAWRLDPAWDRTFDPYLLAGMGQAVARIRRAIEKREPICVYGDYDVDGVTATALLFRVLERLGAEVRFFIPNRFSDGYGLHLDCIRELGSPGSLMISVDCGVRSVEEVAASRELGVEWIITDHHALGPELPSACAVLHPALGDHPNRHLAGVGVAFKLAQSLLDAVPVPRGSEAAFLDGLLKLVALGSLADMVPLGGENALLVKRGLKALAGPNGPGLANLLKAARIEGEPGAQQVVFGVVPRLNATGRMGGAEDAVRLLLTRDAQEASLLSERVERSNTERRAIQKQLLQRLAPHDGSAFDLVMDPNAHKGVIGIVAGRRMRESGVPTAVCTVVGEVAHGSLRAPEGYDLNNLLELARPFLLSGGGARVGGGHELRSRPAALRAGGDDPGCRPPGQGDPPARAGAGWPIRRSGPFRAGPPGPRALRAGLPRAGGGHRRLPPGRGAGFRGRPPEVQAGGPGFRRDLVRRGDRGGRLRTWRLPAARGLPPGPPQVGQILAGEGRDRRPAGCGRVPMKAWRVFDARHPVWRLAGGGLLAFALVGTGIFICRGPRPIEPKTGGPSASGNEGRTGTYTEQLGGGRFLLAYEAILGGKDALQLKGVHGRLEETDTLWLMTSPAARKTEGIWFMDGPMGLEARDPRRQTLMGRGRIERAEPGLKWDHGVWTGLSSLVWEDLQGQGRGRWTLPPGWRRELDGRFVVDHRPVHWEALGKGAVRSLETQSLWTTQGFTNGRMEQLSAQLEGGRLQAEAAVIEPTAIHWKGPIRFQREDGWTGEAESGLVPRAGAKGAPADKVDLKAFRARRSLPEGPETMQAEGARWTPAGIQAEGNVQWEQPRDGARLTLRAPRVLMREAAGGDLPADLPVGEARAEGMVVLTWGNRSLSSPRMEARRAQRTWKLQAPVLGRSEQGTFSAGAGQGSPTRWEFEGPIRATAAPGGSLRGDRLVWENAAWTLTGRPATWNGLRERLSGPKLVRKGETIQFPEGVAGSFSAPEGDVVIRADRGEDQAGLVSFQGRVDCQGLGWQLQAARLLVQLLPGNQVKSVTAKGQVALRGKIGEGRGEYLELDLVNKVARWQGQVKGSAEVQP